MLAHRLEELLTDAAIRIAVHQSHADCTSDGVANLREGYQQGERQLNTRAAGSMCRVS